jgi:hypothetical protein
VSVFAGTDIFGPMEYDFTTSDGVGLIAVCKVTIAGLLETYTTVLGIEGLESPMVGRFLVSDIQNRFYPGYLAPVIERPLTDGYLSRDRTRPNVTNDAYSLSVVQPAEDILRSY